MYSILYKKSRWLNQKSLGTDNITCIALADSIVSPAGYKFRYQIVFGTFSSQLCINFRQTYKALQLTKTLIKALDEFLVVIKKAKRSDIVNRKRVISKTKDQVVYFRFMTNPKTIKLLLVKEQIPSGAKEEIMFYSDVGLESDYNDKKKNIVVKANNIIASLKDYAKYLETAL